MSINGRCWVFVKPTQEIADFIAPYAEANGWLIRACDGHIQIELVQRWFGYRNAPGVDDWDWARMEIGRVRALFPEMKIRYGNDLSEGPGDGAEVTDGWACEPDSVRARTIYYATREP